MLRRIALSTLAILAIAVPVKASAAAACTAPAYHQYDFFVGNWDVYNKKGKRFAHDTVTREMGGCALLEHWYGAGSQGAGYSAFDAQRSHWVQTFFQDDGTVLLLTGNQVADGMLFTGDDIPKPGVHEQNRILFRPLKGGGFEEYWTISTDAGHTWKPVFDGFFRPKSGT